MQWNWDKIWSDGWIFYVITIAIFLSGLGYEVFALYKTKRKFQDLTKNLKFLEDNKNKGISFKGLKEWFKENLLAEKVDTIDLKFRLKQYPREIAVIPRSSLRFIPPILTAIGVLGTFWGMSAGLMAGLFQELERGSLSEQRPHSRYIVRKSVNCTLY